MFLLSLFFVLLHIYLVNVYACVFDVLSLYTPCVHVRGQSIGMHYLLSPFESQESNLGHQFWQSGPLPNE